MSEVNLLFISNEKQKIIGRLQLAEPRGNYS